MEYIYKISMREPKRPYSLLFRRSIRISVEPTNPPYKEKREISERLQLMKTDIAKFDKVIISGSLVEWGDELIPLFTFVIRLDTMPIIFPLNRL